MNRLRHELHEQAGAFVDAMLAKLQGATLEELLEESITQAQNRKKPQRPTHAPAARGKKPTGRLARRSKDEILAFAAGVSAALKEHKDGLRAEQIQKELGLDKRESPRILREGVAAGLLKKKGQKRSTVYFSGSGKVKVGKAKASPARKASKKPTAKKRAPKAKAPAHKKATVAKKTSKKPAPKKSAPKKVSSPKVTKTVAEAARVSK